MGFTITSFFSASIAVSILILMLYLIFMNTKVLSRYGILCAYIFVVFILLRCYLPFDIYCINLTQSIYSHALLPQVQKFFNTTLYETASICITVKVFLTAIWAFGSVISVTKTARGYYHYHKCLRQIPSLNCKHPVYSSFHRAYKDIFPHKQITFRIIQSDIFGTPAVFGMFKPTIILPNIDFTEEELYFVFAHELYHIKHKDFLIKCLCNFASAIQWWNPIITRLLFSLVTQAQELFVDYSISKQLTLNEKITYLECLKKTLISQTINSKHIFALAHNQSERNIRQRFSMITAKEVHGFTRIGLLISLCLFILSYSFIFEPSLKPTIDESGDKVYYYDQRDSYYIRNGEQFDLYIDGQFIHTFPEIFEDLKDFPVYDSIPKKK